MKYLLSPLLASSLLTSLLGAALPAAAEPELLDSVAAIVDEQIVLESSLRERIYDITKRVQASKTALPEASILRQQVLDHLILETLQVQTAERYGVETDDEQVNATIEKMMHDNRMSEAQFTAQLAMEGLTINQLKERLGRDLLIQNIQRGLVAQRITVSDLEIDNFLKSAEAQFWLSPEYRLGHILIQIPQAASESEIKAAKNKAEALHQQLQKGAVFAELAIAHSKGPNALKGGDLGFRKTSDLPTLFAEVVPKIEVGSVSEPVRSAAGFHLIKLYEKKGEQNQVIQQSKARHILIKPSAILTDEQAKQKLIDIRQKILDGTDFAKMAKEHSEDIGSMLAGGDLGWSSPGQFVPEFEKTLSESDIGEISAPFRSEFGWHILQLLERRDEDVTDAMIRNRARNIITGRRFEDELQVWLRELRDDAFVEIKE